MSRRVLVPAFAAFAAFALAPLPAAAQEAPPPGFAPDEAAAILSAFPFADGGLSERSPAAGDGENEEDLRNLIVNLGGPRFVSQPAAGAIPEGRLRRPPPDTTLWPVRFDAAGIGLDDRPAGNPEAWEWAGRTWADRHETNVRVIGLLGAALTGPSAGNAGLGRTLVFAKRLNANAGADIAAGVAGSTSRALAEAIAARSGAPTPEDVAAGLLDAATLGAFLSAAQRPARQREHAAERTAGLAAPFPQPGAESARYESEAAATLPWELGIAVAGAVLHLRAIGNADARWPLTVAEEGGLGLRASGFDAAGFDLVGIAVTDYRGVNPRGTFEASALLAFADGGGRRAWFSLALRFAIGPDSIDIETADAVPVAPARPVSRLFFVPEGSLGALSADDPGAALSAIRAAAVDAGSAFADPLGYTAIAVVADRLPPDAAVELRIAPAPGGIEGYAGEPARHDLGGWRVLAHRAAFALRSEPEFFFKTVFRPGSGRLIDDDPGPRTAGVFSTLLGADAVNAEAGRLAPQAPGRPLAGLAGIGP